MKTSLSLTLRRVRSSVRTDINTGAVTVACSFITCGASIVCSVVTNKGTESRVQPGASGAQAKAYGNGSG